MPAPDKTALVVLATGAEEMEVSIIVDILRRGGVKVTLAGLAGSAAVNCSRGLRVVPDVALGDVAGSFDA
ncbi:MAG TPA: DJ-1/PfpI family protein, partial [Polyangiaceae bacterium]|nr:DJ-1/PfpI family protein [Polyangiaceae bacterium]